MGPLVRQREHSLRAEFETRFGDQGLFRRLRSKVAYTFSKAIDDASTLQSSSGENTGAKMMDQFDSKRERAASAYNLAHLFSFNFTYDLSDLPLRGVAGALFNKWQLNGIGTLASGFPVNLMTGFNRSESTS